MRSHLYFLPCSLIHCHSMMTESLYKRNMFFFCMTAFAQKLPWTQPGNTSCSLSKVDPLTTYHQQEQLCYSTKRAIYQGGHVWGQALACDQVLPSPERYGLGKSATLGWQPFWTIMPEAVASCSALLRCGCKKERRRLWKRVRTDLKCSPLCQCSGNCDHNNSD